MHTIKFPILLKFKAILSSVPDGLLKAIDNIQYDSGFVRADLLFRTTVDIEIDQKDSKQALQRAKKHLKKNKDSYSNTIFLACLIQLYISFDEVIFAQTSKYSFSNQLIIEKK